MFLGSSAKVALLKGRDVVCFETANAGKEGLYPLLIKRAKIERVGAVVFIRVSTNGWKS